MSSLKNSLCQNTKNELRECLLVISKKTLRRPGIEPGSQEWESCMIPLHQRRFDIPEQDLRNEQLFQELSSSVTSVGACRIFLEYIHSPASSVGRA